mmetsp:Transcript_136234/g.435099  ORF Transcript_136234/g.435099 Transcript_136234/m.435099 type:complete len:203 (-) Transcript_136234:309-917(-)
MSWKTSACWCPKLAATNIGGRITSPTFRLAACTRVSLEPRQATDGETGECCARYAMRQSTIGIQPRNCSSSSISSARLSSTYTSAAQPSSTARCETATRAASRLLRLSPRSCLYRSAAERRPAVSKPHATGSSPLAGSRLASPPAARGGGPKARRPAIAEACVRRAPPKGSEPATDLECEDLWVDPTARAASSAADPMCEEW